MNKELEIIKLTEETIKDKIYVIRGQKVMLDFELAEIYGYETKRFNEQIKNNIERFDADMRFLISKEEYKEILRPKKSTSSWGGTRYCPYAFTEEGVYMLMMVLKGELAVSQSRKLIKLFKRMKDYVIQLQNVLPSSDMRTLAIQTQRNTEDIRQIQQQVNDLTVVVKDFTDPNIKKDYLFYNGQTVEADLAYAEIYSYAKKTIHVIDNYIGLKTLVLLKSVSAGVRVVVFSDNVNHGLHQTELADFKREYPNVDITLKPSGGIYHDRYIFIDHGTPNEMIFHCGGSSKDGGRRITSISRVEDVKLYQNIISDLE